MNNSQFFRLIEEANYTNSTTSILAELYQIRDYITDELEIIYTDQIELLEYLVRKLVSLDLRFHFLNNKITIVNCPQEQVEFVAWFVQFFALLESTDENYLSKNHKEYDPTPYHYSIFESDYSPVGLEVSKMKFLYDRLEIVFVEK
jgi:hypothetical protein